MDSIDKILITYLEKFLNQHYSENYIYETSDYDVIEIQVVSKKDNSNRSILLRFGINHNVQQIFISNIFIPYDLRYNGIGKKLILLIYTIAQDFGYEVFIVQLVDSFKEKLLRRGAILIDEDTVLISDTTNLL